jgi:ribosomal protein S18 acetylase RimI-like enzyme
MNVPEVAVAAEEERDRVLSTILLGFSADPLVRWLYPQASDYVHSVPVFDAFCGGAIEQGTAYRTGNFEGAALWFPPGFGPDMVKLSELLTNTISESVLEDVFRVFEAMGGLHPDEAHWYLPVIGVDPAHQGAGMGAALMKHALQIIDAQGLPACLESSNPRNISLYQRHGFEIVDSIQFGGSPVVTPMYRAARS